MKVYINVEGGLFQLTKSNYRRYLRDRIKEYDDKGYTEYDPRPYDAKYLGTVTTINDSWNSQDYKWELDYLEGKD